MDHQFRKGDVVSITGVVRFDQQKEGRLHISVDYADVAINPSDAKLILPHFATGETAIACATDESDPVEVEILATHGEHVWVKTEDGSTSVVKAITLRPKSQHIAPGET